MSTNSYPVFFSPLFLTDSNASLWTMPASSATTTILQEMTIKFHNRTNATRLVTAYAFSTGTASTSNEIIFQHPVPAFDYILVPVHRIQGTSAAIQGFCDVTNAVTAAPIGGKLHVP